MKNINLIKFIYCGLRLNNTINSYRICRSESEKRKKYINQVDMLTK